MVQISHTTIVVLKKSYFNSISIFVCIKLTQPIHSIQLKTMMKTIFWKFNQMIEVSESTRSNKTMRPFILNLKLFCKQPI